MKVLIFAILTNLYLYVSTLTYDPLISTMCLGPSFIRSTMYTVPDTPDMKKQTGVPLGLVIRHHVKLVFVLFHQISPLPPTISKEYIKESRPKPILNNQLRPTLYLYRYHKPRPRVHPWTRSLACSQNPP